MVEERLLDANGRGEDAVRGREDLGLEPSQMRTHLASLADNTLDGNLATVDKLDHRLGVSLDHGEGVIGVILDKSEGLVGRSLGLGLANGTGQWLGLGM